MAIVAPLHSYTIGQAVKKDPDYFLEQFFNERAYDKQQEIMWSVDNNRVTTCRACHDTGKSWTAARTVARYLITHPRSIVITTAPTFRQVEYILWREMRAMHNDAKIKLGGEIFKTHWEIQPDWYAVGMSSNEPERIAGFHAKSGDILIVIDEASGVTMPVYDAIEGMMTTLNARLLLIGNPTSMTGGFHDSHTKWAHAYKIHISCFDTPNFTNNGIRNIADLLKVDMDNVEIVAPWLITPQWVKEKYYQWGYDSPMFQARCLGEFPTQDSNTLIPLNYVELAAEKETHDRLWDDNHDLFLGVDVARYGDDETVITPRQGKVVTEQKVSRKEDTAQTAGRVKLFGAPRPKFIGVDADGVGAGVADILRSDKIDYVFDIHNGSRAIADNTGLTFANFISQLWWHVGEQIKAGELAIPDDEELKSQLSSRRYKVTRQGIAIETKEEYKKRMNGKSPDRADSLMYSFAQIKSQNDRVKPTVGKKTSERYNEARNQFEGKR